MSKPAKFCAKAKDAVPTIAISRNEETIFFGPCLSSKYPSGICIEAKPKKYPPANKPRSPANKLNSEDSNGDKVAVIALKRQDKKYPQANTKKITTAFFIGKTFFSINLD